MSEIPVRFTKNRYLYKIDLHSQYLRWLRSTPCYCINQLGSTDPNCPSCLGRGTIYSHQTDFEVWNERSPHCGEYVYPIKKPIVSVQSVTRRGGWDRRYDVLSHADDWVQLGVTPEMPSLPNQNEVIGVNYTYSTKKEWVKGPGRYIGGGVLVVDLPAVMTIETEQVRGDIIKPHTVYNATNDWNYAVKSWWKNEIYLNVTEDDPVPLSTDIWELDLSYIDPVKLMLNNISAKQRWEGAYIAQQGEAGITVPYEYYIGVGDLFVQLVGEQRGSSLLIQTENFEQVLPAFDVTKLLTIEDGTGTNYLPGTDYVIHAGNRLKWVTGGSKPSGTFSCTFLYHPAFRINNIAPTVRTPENLKMPRRANLEMFDKVNPTEQGAVQSAPGVGN